MKLRSAALSVAVALVLTGCSLPRIPGASPAATPSGPPTTSQVSVSRPVEVRVPAIQAASRLVATGLNPDGTAEVPPVDRPQQASYLDWADAIERDRPLVIYGHVNGVAGGKHVPGVFVRLHELKPGAEVLVQRDTGALETYKITAVERISKKTFPTAKVYDPTLAPEIRLITCTGLFDAGARSYTENFIAYGRIEAD